jgi:Methyltransferase domain
MHPVEEIDFGVFAGISGCISAGHGSERRLRGAKSISVDDRSGSRAAEQHLSLGTWKPHFTGTVHLCDPARSQMLLRSHLMQPNHRHIYQQARAYDVAFGFRDIRAECNTLAALVSRHAGWPVASVLELAAGPARHAREFARRGVAAMALDSMPSMRDYALERAAHDGVGLTAVCADMCDFQLAVPSFTQAVTSQRRCPAKRPRCRAHTSEEPRAIRGLSDRCPRLSAKPWRSRLRSRQSGVAGGRSVPAHRG